MSGEQRWQGHDILLQRQYGLQETVPDDVLAVGPEALANWHVDLRS